MFSPEDKKWPQIQSFAFVDLKVPSVEEHSKSIAIIGFFILHRTIKKFESVITLTIASCT